MDRARATSWWFALGMLCLWRGMAAESPRPHPIVVAHRGASGYLPEHTLPAKAYAHALGADFLEQDIVLTKDDVPIVLHDIYLDTVTDVAKRFPDRRRSDGRYYALDFTLAEVKQLHVSERFDAKTGRAVFPQRFPVGQSDFRLSTLEEELQFIAGLNHSTGRRAGIYPEIKQPKWHRAEGHDISKIVLPMLVRHGYASKVDPCWLQCFELPEVERIRNELGWKGRMVMLIGGGARGEDGTDFATLCTAEGLNRLAGVADGIGPALSRIVTWQTGGKPKISDLTRLAHAANLVVHPYTIRIDELPRNCPSAVALHVALFKDAGIDGTFTDFTDVTIAWLKANGMR